MLFIKSSIFTTKYWNDGGSVFHLFQKILNIMQWAHIYNVLVQTLVDVYENVICCSCDIYMNYIHIHRLFYKIYVPSNIHPCQINCFKSTTSSRTYVCTRPWMHHEHKQQGCFAMCLWNSPIVFWRNLTWISIMPVLVGEGAWFVQTPQADAYRKPPAVEPFLHPPKYSICPNKS